MIAKYCLLNVTHLNVLSVVEVPKIAKQCDQYVMVTVYIDLEIIRQGFVFDLSLEHFY